MMKNDKNTYSSSNKKSELRKNRKKSKKSKNPKTRNYVSALIMLIVAVIVAAGAFWLFSNTIKKASNTAMIAYNDSKNAKSDEVYSEYYKNAFDKAEEKNHVSNRATINIDNIKELAELEVLSASDVEYVISSTQSNVWFEVTGEGVYTVDLSMSEVVADNERNYVLVRVPSPTLSHVTTTNRKTLLYENKSIRDYSIKDGAEKALEMEKEGYEKMKRYMKTTPLFYQTAEKNAESLITSFVKECNPDIPDLQVIIEFYD